MYNDVNFSFNYKNKYLLMHMENKMPKKLWIHEACMYIQVLLTVWWGMDF